MSDFLVERGELGGCRVAGSETPEVGPGQALPRGDRFGLTRAASTLGALKSLPEQRYLTTQAARLNAGR